MSTSSSRGPLRFEETLYQPLAYARVAVDASALPTCNVALPRPPPGLDAPPPVFNTILETEVYDLCRRQAEMSLSLQLSVEAYRQKKQMREESEAAARAGAATASAAAAAAASGAGTAAAAAEAAPVIDDDVPVTSTPVSPDDGEKNRKKPRVGPSPEGATTSWTCVGCTFINDAANNSCSMCETPRSSTNAVPRADGGAGGAVAGSNVGVNALARSAAAPTAGAKGPPAVGPSVGVSAGGPAGGGGAKLLPKSWYCAMCTMANEPGEQVCTVCKVPRK